ncbi:unnamed protein product [Prunus armeniaca]
MPRNEKPLATIIEGRWYSVGKSGRPTLELTRTQKRRRPALPEKGRIRKYFPRRNEQPASHKKCYKQNLQTYLLSILPHPQSISLNHPNLFQLKDKKTRLKNDQNGLLETGEQEDWTEEYGEEQMEYDVELDEETEAFGAELENMLQGDLGINMVFILPEEFRATEGQENTLKGDVVSQESFECRLAEVEEAPEQQTPTAKTSGTTMKLATEQLCFSKPTKEMANHLRPLFITANFRGIPIPKVMVDGGTAINLLPHRLLSKMGRTEKDLIPTRLTVTNFAGSSLRLMESWMWMS